MNDKDKRYVKRLIYYCDRLEDHIEFFGDDREIFFN